MLLQRANHPIKIATQKLGSRLLAKAFSNACPFLNDANLRQISFSLHIRPFQAWIHHEGFPRCPAANNVIREIPCLLAFVS